MDLNSRNQKRRDTVEAVASESGCSLAVGDDGGFPGTAAKSGNFSPFSGSAPVEAADVMNTCLTPSTVVGISGLGIEATDKGAAAFSRLDSQDVISPTAEDDQTISNAPAMFKKDNGGNLQSSLCEPESLLVSQEDHSIGDRQGYSQPLENQSSSPAPEEDTHCGVESNSNEAIINPQFSREESIKESGDEEDLMRVYLTKKAETSQWLMVDTTSVANKSEKKTGNSSHDGNAILPSSIPEASVKSIPEHRRVDSGSLSTIQQLPTGKADHWNSKALSYPPEEMKLQPFQSPYSEEDQHSDTETASLIEEEECEDSSHSEEYKNDISFEAPVNASNDNYREDKEWTKGNYIGHGASAYCYLATDKRTNNIMAVKQIDRKIKNDREISFEVDIMRGIRHDNIVRFIRAAPAEKVYNIFMEYMPGCSVEYLLEKYGKLTEEKICHYIKQLLSAVMYLHSKSIALREIRCAHLMLDKTRKVLRVIDFGSAARFDEVQKFCEVAGTLWFMAPEVKSCDGITPYTSKSDIWSMGCVIVHMARPIYGLDLISTYLSLKYKECELPMPKFGDSNLQDMMVLCLQVDQHKRPTAQEIYHTCFL